MRVSVYFNLHRKLFSVRAEEGPAKGRVIAHAPAVILDRPTFKVSEAGRQRVLRERRKNVHAYVCGELHGLGEGATLTEAARGAMMPALMGPGTYAACRDQIAAEGERVTYNPYLAGSFIAVETEEAATSASAALLEGKSIRALDVTTTP